MVWSLVSPSEQQLALIVNGSQWYVASKAGKQKLLLFPLAWLADGCKTGHVTIYKHTVFIKQYPTA